MDHIVKPALTFDFYLNILNEKWNVKETFASVGDRVRRHEAGPRRHRRARPDGATLHVDLDSSRRHLHLLQGLPQQVSHVLN